MWKMGFYGVEHATEEDSFRPDLPFFVCTSHGPAKVYQTINGEIAVQSNSGKVLTIMEYPALPDWLNSCGATLLATPYALKKYCFTF